MRVSNRFRGVSPIFALLLASGSVLAQGIPQSAGSAYAPSPYAGMYGSMSGVYGNYYRYVQPRSMAGVVHPRADSYNGMGRVYDPFHRPPEMTGMYGSMSGVYGNFYRPAPFPGMGGMAGMLGR